MAPNKMMHETEIGSSCTVEITVISAESLRFEGCLKKKKKKTFAVVHSGGYYSDSKRTKIDSKGGSYPQWDEKLNLVLPYNVRYITAEVHCDSVFGDAILGRVDIPVSDFTGDYTPPQYLHFLSYRLRDCKGERNGIINLSVRQTL